MSGKLSPPLQGSDYLLMSWAGDRIGEEPLLANHDFCAGFMTLTGKQCLLDISFECIPDKVEWFDYENFFWVKTASEMYDIVTERGIERVAYSSGDRNREVLESLVHDKVYSSWSCTDRCERDSAYYLFP